jgi:hypothetical protein
MQTVTSLLRFVRPCGLALVALAAGPTVLGAGTVPTETPARVDAAAVSLTATIESLDYDTREVTLKGPLGNLVTVTADPAIERLRELKVGDSVKAEYLVSVAFELREPTPEERAEPFVVLDAAGKAPAESAPAAAAARRVRAVCTIEGLDRPTETVTLKGPRGRYAAVQVADPANLPHLRIGQSVVVTYTEALALSIEKATATE